MYSTFTFSYSSLWLINLMATGSGYKKVSQVWLCSLNFFFFFWRESNHKKNNKIKNTKSTVMRAGSKVKSLSIKYN